MYPKLNGFNTKSITLYTNEDIPVGAPVKLMENAVAAMPTSGEKFCGVCTDKRGNYVTVTFLGYAETAYSGTAPTVGYNKLSSDGKGSVATNDNGRELLVLDVDTVNKTIAFLL